MMYIQKAFVLIQASKQGNDPISADPPPPPPPPLFVLVSAHLALSTCCKEGESWGKSICRSKAYTVCSSLSPLCPVAAVEVQDVSGLEIWSTQLDHQRMLGFFSNLTYESCELPLEVARLSSLLLYVAFSMSNLHKKLHMTATMHRIHRTDGTRLHHSFVKSKIFARGIMA